VDYHFISKGVYDMRQVYNKKEGYIYFHGINPAAAIAWIVGAVFYLWTYNPFTMVSANGWFPYISAGVPTCILTGAIYYTVMKVWVMKAWPQPLQLIKAEKETDGMVVEK
jgi:nucleobase:cation symporter-1, NCS1 family